jgi:hypothetical protein
MAGFGTAGCVLACAAALLRSPVWWSDFVAGRRWADRTHPRADGSPRARGWAASRGARTRSRVRDDGGARYELGPPRGQRRRRLCPRPSGRSRRGAAGPQLPTQAGSGRPSGTGNGPTGTGNGPTGTGGGPLTTVTTPTTPPVVPPCPTGGPGTVIKKVSATAGDAVSGAGSRLGSAVGGSAGGAVTGTAGGAGGAVSKLGAGVGNLLGN